MLYQIINVIKIYYEFEVITRFDIKNTKSFPNIYIYGFPVENKINLFKTHPSFRDEFKDINSTEKYINNLVYNQYLYELLSENRINEFEKIVGFDQMIKTCHIISTANITKCPKPRHGIYVKKSNRHINLFTYYRPYEAMNINGSQLSSITLLNDNYIQKIRLSLFTLNHPFLSLSFGIQSQSTSHTVVKQNALTRASFIAYSSQRLAKPENNCIDNKDLFMFNADYFEFCAFDKYYTKINETYGCIPIAALNEHFDFHRYIYEKNLRFCEKFINTSSVIALTSSVCKTKCNSIYTEMKTSTTNVFNNETILEVIPLDSAHIVYFETLKTDFNKLIYNCGGILGLWFGLYPFNSIQIIIQFLGLFKLFGSKLIGYLKISVKKLCGNPASNAFQNWKALKIKWGTEE